MIYNLKNSLAFRIPVIYKKILAVAGSKKSENKSTNPTFNLVMLVGTAQLNMLRETLNSIISNFESLPVIYIFTDKNLDPAICKKYINWKQPSPIHIIDALTCIAYHSLNVNLIKFADKNPMGLKLAAILQIADQGSPVLYCDTDVLWFKDPNNLVQEVINNDNIALSLSYDFQQAYDHNLIRKGALEVLNDHPFYCAGLLVLKRISLDFINKLQELLKIAVTDSNHFTEQTIFAYFNKIGGNFGLDKEEFLISLEDQYNLLPSSINPTARHYIGPVRHIFWRDAFFMRFKKILINPLSLNK